MTKNRCPGFTLAELLIALAILGVIATFTIPKILNSQQMSSSNAKAKEVAGMVGAAYQLYKMQNPVTASFTIADLTPYMNYVQADSSTVVDTPPLNSTIQCGTVYADCLKLHNGGMLRYYSGWQMGGTENNYAVWFDIDPDGVASSNNAGAALQFWLYANGTIRTYGTMVPGTCSGGYCSFNPDPSWDPAWFSW